MSDAAKEYEQRQQAIEKRHQADLIAKCRSLLVQVQVQKGQREPTLAEVIETSLQKIALDLMTADRNLKKDAAYYAATKSHPALQSLVFGPPRIYENAKLPYSEALQNLGEEHTDYLEGCLQREGAL